MRKKNSKNSRLNKKYQYSKKNSIDINSIDFEDYDRKKAMLTSFFLDVNYVPMSLKQIENFLNIKEHEAKKLLEYILNELESEFNIYKDNNKYIVISKNTGLYICSMQIKSANFGFGIDIDGSNEDIYIPSEHNKNAMDKDIILVKIIQDNKYGLKKVGKVVNILKRNTQYIIGKYHKSTNFGFVVPIDSKLRDVYISKKNNLSAKTGDMVKVIITKYPEKSNKAEGKIVEILGTKYDDNIEIKALYKSYGLDEKEKFNNSIEKELEKIPSKISLDLESNRVNRISDNIYTIDSEDAKDLDDAICVKKIDNIYFLSVHIADVSHYVKAGSNLDKEAISRATSIYIPGKVIPMLPKKLSNGICSLNEGQERFTLSIDMKIDNKGNVLESNIYKGIINVKKKMTYEKVFKFLIGEDKEVVAEYSEYDSDIMLMKELAEILKAKREKSGSINFDIPETKVVLDEAGNLRDIKEYEVNIANNIIEEFMLITNMTIAERFYFLEAPFIYRVHEKPAEDSLRQLNELISNYNKHIKGLKDIHPKAIADILEGFENKESKAVISKLVLRTLKLARYSEECLGHFGLASKYYCHFTSPIRRYPDLFIHRVISDYLVNDYSMSNKKLAKYFKQAKQYAKISSDMEKESTKIERDFNSLYKAMYMKDKIGEEFDAVVSSVTTFGMFVKLENTVEGLVPLDLITDDYYIFDEKNYRLMGKRTNKVYKIGDELKVRLVRADVMTKQIDFELC